MTSANAALVIVMRVTFDAMNAVGCYRAQPAPTMPAGYAKALAAQQEAKKP